MQNNFGLNFKTNLNKINGDFRKFQSNTSKVNMKFANMTKDANRASTSIKKLSGSFSGLNTVIKGVSFVAIGRGLGTLINSSLDMIETTHLFNVAMGDMAEETGKFVDNIAGVTGLDTTNIHNAVGTFSLLGRSMGMSSDQARILSTNTYQLGLDLASLTNVPVNQAMQDLRSGLVGQSETMYKYGVDVTEATLKQEAFRQGITKSVRNMSQGEKMALRYAVMIRQTALAHGDFSETINEPANQLKILGERMTGLGRAFGSMFVPLMKTVLPYLNAVVKVLTRIVSLIASLFGYEPPEVEDTGGGFSNIEDGANDATDAIDGTSKAMKKLNNLLGVDELNVMSAPTVSQSGAGGTGVGVGSIEDFEFPELGDLFSDIKQKSDEISESIESLLESFMELFKPLTDADFTKLIESFDKLKIALEPFVDNVGSGLLWLLENVLVPLSVWTITEIAPRFLELLANILDLLNTTIEIFKPTGQWLFDNFLLPLAKWTGGVILDVLDGLNTALEKLTEWMKNNESTVRNMGIAIGLFFGAFQLAKVVGFVEMSGGLVTAITNIKDALKVGIFAKFISKLEDSYILLLYAKDAMVKLASGGIGILTGALKLLTSKFALIVLAVIAVIAIGVLLWKNWDEIKEKASEIWGNIKTTLSDIWDNLKEKASETWDKMKEKVEVIWGDIGKFFTEKVPEIISNIVKFFSELPSKIAFELGKIAGTIATWVVNAVGWVVKEVPKIVTKIIEFIAEIPSKAKEKLDKFQETITTWVKNSVQWVTSEVPKIINKIIEFISTIPAKAKEKLDKFKDTIGTWVSNSITWIGNELPKLLNNIIDWFGKLPESLVNIGSNMIKGIWNGMASMGSWLLNKFKDFFGGAWDFVGDLFSDFGRGFNATFSPNVKLARGGSLSRGQIFEAGEFGKAELIGNHQGRTTVMPLENTSFVSAIKTAVMEGVSNASGGGGSNQPLIINIGGDKIVDTVVSGINRQGRINGKTIIEV